MGIMESDLARHTENLKDFIYVASQRQLKKEAEWAGAAALIHEDHRFVLLSTIAYSFAKLFDKPYIAESKDFQELVPKTLERLDTALDALTAKDYKEYEKQLRGIVGDIKHLSQTVGRFVVNIVDKARIKSATQIYAHGASLGRAAELGGVDKRELASYVGQTRLTDKYETVIPVRKRLVAARKLFK